jgi:RNA exonuclease 1
LKLTTKCYTKNGLEVARVTLVTESKQVLYDKIVKPLDDIIDFNTRFSGITEEHMKGVTLRLSDVHKVFSGLISNDTILVGHSLENDLRALKVRPQYSAVNIALGILAISEYVLI